MVEIRPWIVGRMGQCIKMICPHIQVVMDCIFCNCLEKEEIFDLKNGENFTHCDSYS